MSTGQLAGAASQIGSEPTLDRRFRAGGKLISILAGVYLSRRHLLLALAALPIGACAGDDGPAPIVGREAPPFSLRSIDGGEISLKSLRGKPVVVNFFATWCGPCVTELPAFQAQAARHADQGLSFLLVDMQEDADTVAVFLGELGVTLPAVLDQTGEVAKTYRVRGLPSTFFVDREGIIRSVHLGALDENLLQMGIAKIV